MKRDVEVERQRECNIVPPVRLKQRSHCTSLSMDPIDFAWGCSRNALWVNPFCRLCCLRQEVENCSTFQAVTDPSANQTTPPYIRHALRHPSTDTYNVNATHTIVCDGFLLEDSDTGYIAPGRFMCWT